MIGNSLANTIICINTLNKISVLNSVVMGIDFSVSFWLLGHNRNPNRPKFMKQKLLVVISTSFLAIFPEYLLFISTKTTRRKFF